MKKYLFLTIALLCAVVQGAWAQTDKETPLTLEARTAGRIVINSPKSGMQYSVNGGAKTAVSTEYGQFVINVSVDDKVQFYGTGTSLTRYAYSQINGDAEYYVYGNIMSLVDEYNFATATTLTSESAFATLFYENEQVFNHPTRKLVLPATTLTNSCYELMFCRCTNLTEAPVLPATTLKNYCYKNMFNGCTKLNSMTCYANSWASGATTDWLHGVAATGTFVKANEKEWDRDNSGIPSGWTVENAFTYVTTEEELNSAITGGANIIKLMEDITLAQRVEIPENTTVTLDLNGHTLSRNQDGYHWYFMVIHNNGNLTINDSSGDNSGKITGGHAYGGAGIYCEAGSKLTFNGGTIIGNSSTNDPSNGAGFGGGILINSGAEATITGGVISGNSAPQGGGIYNQGTLTLSNNALISGNTGNDGGGIFNSGTLNINGGSIIDNLANYLGGGGITNYGTINMTGGSITANTSTTAGGGIWNGGTLNMQGIPVVSGNTSTANGVDNVFLNDNKVISVTGAFAEGTKIGVAPSNTSNAITSNYSTYNQGTTPDNFFSSDTEFHKLSLNGDSEVALEGAEGNWIDYRAESYSNQSSYSVAYDKYYTIYIENEAEFALMAYNVNNTKYNSFNHYTFILNTDLDMSAHYWTPIGAEPNYRFEGNFNGNGHTISGIYVNSEGLYNGLFGIVAGSSDPSGSQHKGCDYIKNFVLKDSYIKGGNYTGGVVGFMFDGMTLENVFCQADVTGGSDVGGIVGKVKSFSELHSTRYVTTINNCLYLSGTVSATGNNRAAVIGTIVSYYNLLSLSNNYYIDPTSYVGNDNDVRAYPITTIIPDGSTCSYNAGVDYNGFHYHHAGTVNLTVRHDLTQIVTSVKVNGDELVGSEGNYTFTIDPAAIDPYELSVTASPSPIAGSGTQANPYLIDSQEDWNFIADYLNSGQASNNFNGVHFQLAADDVTIDQRMGTYDHPFCGTFDGDGRTLTLAFGSAESYSDQECAPFYRINNATIRNLVIAGHIYSSAQHNAGFAARAMGKNNRIQNCVSNVSIHSNRSGSGDAGDCTNGGFIGMLNIDETHVYFNGCAFTGELLGASATNWGGFVGWAEYPYPGCYLYFTDCLFAPTTVDIATPDGSNSRTFCRRPNLTGYSNHTFYTNCYYTTVIQVADGGKKPYSLTTAPANIGAEGTNYGFVTAYANGLKYGERYYVNPEAVSLANAADNSETISGNDGYLANVTLSDRTLYRDKDWNTLCLPFDVTLADSPLKGVEARTLGEATFNAGTLTLNFSEPVNEITAGTPYIIRWNDDAANIVSPVFNGVIINATEPARITPGLASGTTGDGCVTFQGIYDPLEIGEEGDNTKLYFSTDNTLYWPNGAMTFNPFRAYLQLNTAVANIRAYQINFGEDETTGIKSLTPDPSSKGEGSDGWYDLNGRKLDGKPTTKGVYIHNGRKMVVK